MKFEVDQAIVLLNRTPQVVSEMLLDLPEDWINSREGPNSWSPKEVVGHLILGEQTDWIPRAHIILNDEKDKMFEPFDMKSHIRDVRDKSMEQLLKHFEFLRTANVKELESMSLDAEQLRRKGVHPEFGGVSLRELLSTWVVHDLTHIAQISRVLAKQYEEEVGPWKQYLGILKR